MGDPHRQNVGALDTAMVVRHRDNFNSARGPFYISKEADGSKRQILSALDPTC